MVRMRRLIVPGVRTTRIGRLAVALFMMGRRPTQNSRHQTRIRLRPPQPRYRHGLCPDPWHRRGSTNSPWRIAELNAGPTVFRGRSGGPWMRSAVRDRVRRKNWKPAHSSNSNRSAK
jgi:hypothetical protein